MKLEHNPRFVIYARAHGNTAAEQLHEDSVHWRRGKAFGFMVWLSRRLDEWSKETGIARIEVSEPDNMKAFTRWLDRKYPE